MEISTNILVIYIVANIYCITYEYLPTNNFQQFSNKAINLVGSDNQPLGFGLTRIKLIIKNQNFKI